MVRVRLFAQLREAAGRDEVVLGFKEPIAISVLIQQVFESLPGLEKYRDRLLIARNQELVERGDLLVLDGDEVALMPPFSGGSGVGGRVQLQAEDFSIDEEVRRIRGVSGRIGGIAIFLGTARDFSRGRSIQSIRFETYGAMALRRLGEIRDAALKAFDIVDVSIIHRIGAVSAGEQIVLIVAAGAHRKEAFDACRYCIDQLKASAPIWKAEETSEGIVWVEDRP